MEIRGVSQPIVKQTARPPGDVVTWHSPDGRWGVRLEQQRDVLLLQAVAKRGADGRVPSEFQRALEMIHRAMGALGGGQAAATGSREAVSRTVVRRASAGGGIAAALRSMLAKTVEAGLGALKHGLRAGAFSVRHAGTVIPMVIFAGEQYHEVTGKGNPVLRILGQLAIRVARPLVSGQRVPQLLIGGTAVAGARHPQTARRIVTKVSSAAAAAGAALVTALAAIARGPGRLLGAKRMP